MQRKHFGRLVISSVLFLSVLTSQLEAKNIYIWNVPHYTQESSSNCGIAVARMWIAYITHHRKRPSENEVYYRTYPLGRNGVSANEMRVIMSYFTRKKFQYHNAYSKTSAGKYIYKELREQGRPVAIVGATRYNQTNNWKVIPGKHWLLVWAGDIKSKGSGYKHKWVAIHDPLFQSKHAWRFVTIPYWKRIKRDELYDKIWLKIGSGRKFRQLVED